MTKAQLITLIQDKLNGGVTNTDNQRKFHYRDVEYMLGIVWSSSIDQMKDAKVNVAPLMQRIEVSIDEKGKAELSAPYIDFGSGFPIAYAEDYEASEVIWPRKNQFSDMVMSGLHAGQHLATVTPYPDRLSFRNLDKDRKKAWVWLFPVFEYLDSDQQIKLPARATEIIYTKVVEISAMKHQIPVDNINDNV